MTTTIYDREKEKKIQEIFNKTWSKQQQQRKLRWKCCIGWKEKWMHFDFIYYFSSFSFLCLPFSFMIFYGKQFEMLLHYILRVWHTFFKPKKNTLKSFHKEHTKNFLNEWKYSHFIAEMLKCDLINFWAIYFFYTILISALPHLKLTIFYFRYFLYLWLHCQSVLLCVVY